MEDEFDFTAKDLKHYPHFDAPITLKEIRHLVTDPQRVAANSFYPFFLYEESWQPYRSTDAAKPDKKTRPIRYGARRDAYIFAFYRRKLSRLYEARLREMGIEDCPIAYRQVLKPRLGGGKCNIDFAKDAFDEIDRLGDCVAVALDIKGYFENLDHKRIKSIWCDLLGVDELPPDHYAVFKNITKYRYVDQRSVYSRLPDLIALASKPASEEIGNDDTRDMGLQRPDENHLGQLAPSVVPAVRPVLLPVQGHVPLGNLVADHGQRPVGRLPPVQPRHRAAPLPSQGVGAGMTGSTSAQAVCHPSGTRHAISKPSANADCMKRLGNLGPAYARQTDR
ncbi:hypothetical protein ACFOM8_18155 [Paracoccus angustae]|uniref:Reverse transcriptase n=1 Tax=Paracoccus angustae TaxID=1671480 RepID=A0ABV7U8D3_9RHOB